MGAETAEDGGYGQNRFTPPFLHNRRHHGPNDLAANFGGSSSTERCVDAGVHDHGEQVRPTNKDVDLSGIARRLRVQIPEEIYIERLQLARRERGFHRGNGLIGRKYANTTQCVNSPRKRFYLRRVPQTIVNYTTYCS
jgi:hypothetical protein